MRLALAAVLSIALAAPLAPGMGGVAPAEAQECTGDNCPPPSGQGRGSHCEKTEDAVS